jgi:curved DNA-binding protein CbpA
VDPGLDLDVETQQRILEFEARLEAPYHEILGVDVRAEPKAIKRAYFKLSREFHPDRYFRKEIGDFGARLQRIFRKLLEAQEMLSDPTARAELERSLAQAPPQPPPTAAAPGPKASPAEVQRRLRLFARHAKVVTERKQRAKRYFESGMSAFQAERWLEAASSVRLAMAFDPGNEAYRDSFIDVQQRAYEERAKQLVKDGEAALEVRDYPRALALFEEALYFRPQDAELHHRTARLGWRTGEDLRKAKELAQAACDLRPDEAPYRRTLGQIYKTAGLEANARRELRRALELDPSDKEARNELGSLGRG